VASEQALSWCAVLDVSESVEGTEHWDDVTPQSTDATEVNGIELTGILARKH
jgi:hypothetical protein